jgi:hypothetical protein
MKLVRTVPDQNVEKEISLRISQRIIHSSTHARKLPSHDPSLSARLIA